MAGQLWVRVIRKNKIIESRTAPCTYEAWQQALDDICHGLDISRPVILPRHERDWEQFGLTHFLPGKPESGLRQMPRRVRRWKPFGSPPCRGRRFFW